MQTILTQMFVLNVWMGYYLFILVPKSSVTSALIEFTFALSVLRVWVDITNFTVGNSSKMYCSSFPVFSTISVALWKNTSRILTSGKQQTLISIHSEISLSLRLGVIELPVTRTVPFFQTVSSSTSAISGKPGLVRLLGDVTFTNLW